MSEHSTVGVQVGPVFVASTRERKPAQDESPRTKWVLWAITVFLLAQASPLAGVVLILGTAVWAAGHYAPKSGTTSDRTTDERTAR